jgi:hypothetical protein
VQVPLVVQHVQAAVHGRQARERLRPNGPQLDSTDWPVFVL